MTATYTLTIDGISFGIRSDEDEAYLRGLEEQLNTRIDEIRTQGVNGIRAALYLCMETLDKLHKTEEALEELKNRTEKPKKSAAELFFPDKDQTSLFKTEGQSDIL